MTYDERHVAFDPNCQLDGRIRPNTACACRQEFVRFEASADYFWTRSMAHCQVVNVARNRRIRPVLVDLIRLGAQRYLDDRCTSSGCPLGR
jgi:hypothetical protein